MKKLLLILFALFALIGCKCSHVEPYEINVEDINLMDCDYMSETYGDFKWYECDIRLKGFLDEENNGSIDELVNVFQVNDSVNSMVYKIQHFSDGTHFIDSVEGFYIENLPMELENVKVSYTNAFIKINEINYPKEHSKNVCIRKPLGPIECNEQFIFGKSIWVDATTGEVSTTDPAFPKE